MIKAFKYRLLPTPEQEATLVRWMSMCRFVYNLGLETKKRAWEQRVNLGSYELMRQLTDLKNSECQWLKDCSAQTLESAIANLDEAYKRFYKGNGFPKFKKRSGRQSITFRRDSRIAGGKIFLTKIGGIDFIQHRRIGIGQIRACTVSKTPSGAFFISIAVKDENVIPEKRPVIPETTTGIDLGIKTFATLSDGQTFDNPKYLHRQLKRLRVEQRTMRRRLKIGVKIQDQSKGYHKQKLVVAKLHEKIANQRNDFLHKVSTAIIKQYDTVCLEDLNIAGMMKNGSLAKAISDVSWYEFTRLLEYKAEWYGKNIVRIGRFQPSSKTCSCCGHVLAELDLSVREWACVECGSRHDRDLNAANNIKNFGLKTQPLTANAEQSSYVGQEKSSLPRRSRVHQ